MTKFLVLWEVDTTKIPDKPVEMQKNFTMMLNMVKKNLDSGGTKDWGMFIGRHAGYSIKEGTEQEIALSLLRFSPYLKFKVYPIISVNDALENVKALSQT